MTFRKSYQWKERFDYLFVTVLYWSQAIIHCYLNRKEYGNELSVITEENSGVYIEPHRKISSDASSGGRTDTSQLFSAHEEWSQSGLRSPILEDLHDISETDFENQRETSEIEADDAIITIDRNDK